MERLILGNPEGKTLLEKMLGREEERAPGPEDNLYNPLQLGIKDLVELTFEEAGTYGVVKLIAYTSQIGEKTFRSIRYFLRDTVAVEDTAPLVLELMQADPSKQPEIYLFHITEGFEYDEEFVKLLEDEIFIITEEVEGEFFEKEYEKTFHVTAALQIIGEDRSVSTGEVKVWNYERQEEMETSYLVIELNTENGWTTFYEGRKLLEAEVEIYRLSG